MTSESIGWDPLRVELLWDLKERPRRGPKPALTVAQIARCGMDIADNEGLGAVSMQRIAEGLGVGTMTLYTYIPDKASLLEVMLDMAFDGTTPLRSRRGWRGYLQAGAEAILAAYQRHPWALQVFIGGPPLGPNQMRFLEAALQAMAQTSLDDKEKIDAVMAIASYVRGSAHVSIGIMENMRQSGMTEEQLQAAYGQAYARVLDPQHFPMASELFAPDESEAPPASDNSEDFGFRFGLTRLLDGIERHIESKSSTR